MLNLNLAEKQLILFDLDGTLVDSAFDLYRAMNLSLARLNLPQVTEQQVRVWIGKGTSLFCESTLKYLKGGKGSKEILKELTNLNVELENDANCAALGEAKAGAGEGVANFVAVTLGTGVGSGIVVNGKLLNGCNDAAGEAGHMVIFADGEQCTCGRKGCWEAYSSATALIRQTKEAMGKNLDSAMWTLVDGDINKVDGRTAFNAMRKNDPAGIKVVDTYIHYLAMGITNMINLFQPEILCVGGGIGNEGESLLEPVRKIVNQEHYSVHSVVQTRICSAKLGNDAGIIGAALLDE